MIPMYTIVLAQILMTEKVGSRVSIYSRSWYVCLMCGIDSLAPGYYAGLLSSGFMIGRIFSSNFWGVVADRYGSRFVLVCGLVATAVLSIAFGYSKHFAFAFTCR